MRRFLLSLALSALCLGGASALAENIVGDYAVLRALDKVSAATEDFTVKVGDTLEYGSLLIDVKHCEKRPPEEIPETYVFLQIFQKPLSAQEKVEKSEDQDSDARSDKLFSGWMLASNPAISALDHRVYDVWVLDCKKAS